MDHDTNSTQESDDPSPNHFDQKLPSQIDLGEPVTHGRLGKRARTAYFIFQDEKRAEIREQTKGSVADIAKAIGQLWAGLSREEKEVYQLKAAEEREEVSKALQQLKEMGQLNLDTDIDLKEGDTLSTDGLVLPLARIRKICHLDPEVRGISKEATLLVAKAAELFTNKLTKEAMVISQMQNRRKCLPEDVVEVCSLKDAYQFLREDVRDLLRDQKLSEKKNASVAKDKVESKTSGQNTKSIASYFGRSEISE